MGATVLARSLCVGRAHAREGGFMSASPGVSSEGRGIFISYARDDDEEFAKRLWLDLKNHGFRVWWDREAMESRGRTFLQEIRDRVVLLDLPEFLRGDMIDGETGKGIT